VSTQAPVQWGVGDSARYEAAHSPPQMSTVRLCGAIRHFHHVLNVCFIVTHWNIQVKKTHESRMVDGVVGVCGCATQIHACKSIFFFASRMGSVKLLLLRYCIPICSREDGGSRFIRNVGTSLSDFTMSHSRSSYSCNSPPCESRCLV
jgi:hypothetical protein